jgi:hypothetical protein
MAGRMDGYGNEQHLAQEVNDNIHVKHVRHKQSIFSILYQRTSFAIFVFAHNHEEL